MNSSSSNRVARFSRGRACPVCKGSDSDPRGQGKRCHGFLSDDGEWVHCSREQFAGGAAFHSGSQTWSHKARGPCPCGEEHAPAVDAAAKPGIEHVYRYRDADGRVVHETVRYKDKAFRQRRPLGNGQYAWDLKGVEPVLYNLPALIAADPDQAVWIVEGEKDADRLGSLGLLATTNAMGAGKWRDAYAEALRGRHCYVLPDNDDKGRDHAQAVARSLHGKAASVRVVELPGLPSKGDVSDWLDAGRDVGRLAEMADETPLFSSPPAEPAQAKEGNGRQVPADNGAIDYGSLSPDELGIVSAATIKGEATDWLWQYRLAKGEMALIAGEGGLGKSQLLLSITAAVSRGTAWPDGSGLAPLGRVVILSAEDSPSKTIVPRLTALGADLTNVTIVKAKVTIRREGKDPIVHPVSLQNLAYWRAVFDNLPDTVLFIVDPIPSYLGSGVNDQRNNEIRQVIEPFIDEVIRPRDICFFANTHLNKSLEAKSAIHRVSGSIAYGNLPRNVHFVVRDPDRRDQRYFTQVKSNNAPDDLPAIPFRVERRIIECDGVEIETSVPVFDASPVKGLDLDRILSGDRGSRGRGPQPVKSSQFAEWLWEQLEPGPVALHELIEQARESGYLIRPAQKCPKPSLSPLYNARDRVPSLHPGWEVTETTVESGIGAFRKERKAWKLIPSPAAQEVICGQNEGSRPAF